MTEPKPITASSRSLDIRYAIRDVVLPAKELQKQGHEITWMNIGDPNVFDFDTPEHIRTAYKDALDNDKNGYTPSEGVPELLDAIVKKERVDGVDIAKEDIVVTTGVTEALMISFGSIFEPGDEFLVPGPCYPPYQTYAKFFGATPVSYRTVEEDGWQPDIDDLRSKITPKTKALSLICPNNPTGALYTRSTLQKLLDVVAEHDDIVVLSDEIYDKMTYEGEFVSPAAVNKDLPMMLYNGISKVYLAPGWRVGYVAFRDPNRQLSEIKTGLGNLARARLCATSVGQYAYAAALNGPQDHIEVLKSKLMERRDFVYKRVNEIPGLSMQKPGGAFYFFPKIEHPDYQEKDKEFVLEMLKNTHTLFVHGSGFCPVYGKGHFRGVFLPPVEVMEKSFDRIEGWMKVL